MMAAWSGSLLEGGEFSDCVPEWRGLSFGFCQGKDLLLGNAGGDGDVSLVDGMQVLVGRNCWKAVVSNTCDREQRYMKVRVTIITLACLSLA